MKNKLHASWRYHQVRMEEEGYGRHKRPAEPCVHYHKYTASYQSAMKIPLLGHSTIAVCPRTRRVSNDHIDTTHAAY